MHIDKIDQKKFDKIYQTFKDTDPDPGASKYLDLERYFPQNLYFAHKLNLHRMPKQKILDIGCGTGFFLYICKNYGHEVQGIDLDGIPMYNELVQLFELDRKTWEVQAYQPIPDFRKKFNLITAFMICFNNHKTENVWGPSEWHYFLKDLVDNQLTPDGQVFLYLNPENDGTWYNDELLGFFKNHGAKVVLDQVHFKSMDSFRTNG